MSNNPYDALSYSSREPAAPAILPWFKAFCIVMALMYLVVVGLGIFLIAIGSQVPQRGGDLPPAVAGAIYGCVGFPLMVVYGTALFLPRRKWVWVFDLVLIALSMTSCCCLPAAIPLLIYWVKADTRKWFGFE